MVCTQIQRKAGRSAGRVALGALVAIAALVSLGVAAVPARAVSPLEQAAREAAQANVQLLTPELAERLKAEAAAKAAAGDPSAQACGNVAWYSLANFKYVSVEIGYTGSNYAMLRARASSIGSWEKFTFCFYSDYGFTLRAHANGLYVAAELGYTGLDYGMLRARSATVGSWERFRLYYGDPTPFWWRSEANSRFVQAAVGYDGMYYGMLRAASTAQPPNTGSDVKFYRITV